MLPLPGGHAEVEPLGMIHVGVVLRLHPTFPRRSDEETSTASSS
jgi:hypothetical protein